MRLDQLKDFIGTVSAGGSRVQDALQQREAKQVIKRTEDKTKADTDAALEAQSKYYKYMMGARGLKKDVGQLTPEERAGILDQYKDNELFAPANFPNLHSYLMGTSSTETPSTTEYKPVTVGTEPAKSPTNTAPLLRTPDQIKAANKESTKIPGIKDAFLYPGTNVQSPITPFRLSGRQTTPLGRK